MKGKSIPQHIEITITSIKYLLVWTKIRRVSKQVRSGSDGLCRQVDGRVRVLGGELRQGEATRKVRRWAGGPGPRIPSRTVLFVGVQNAWVVGNCQQRVSTVDSWRLVFMLFRLGMMLIDFIPTAQVHKSVLTLSGFTESRVEAVQIIGIVLIFRPSFGVDLEYVRAQVAASREPFRADVAHELLLPLGEGRRVAVFLSLNRPSMHSSDVLQ